MDEKSRPLTDKVWSKLDRKATAILELTLRQYRTRLSTWTVFGVGIILILITSLFYIEAMNNPEIEMIDNSEGVEIIVTGYVSSNFVEENGEGIVYDHFYVSGLLILSLIHI